ncbi:malto-oligosyltrehalose synthase, partial [Nonomuraea sp. NPDC005501]
RAVRDGAGALTTGGPAAAGGTGTPGDEGRARAVAVATRLPVRLARRGGWGATTLTLPPGSWRDLLTGAVHTGRVPLAHLLNRHPVALLERHDL